MAKKKKELPAYTMIYAVSSLLLIWMILFQVYEAVVPPRIEGAQSEEERGNRLAIPAMLEDTDP